MATKPTRVRYSGIAPFIDDTQGNRIQALGSSSRLTTEDMKELGTLNIVEVVDDVPQVDVSIDQNENGTNDLLALFSNQAYGCQVVAVPVSGSATSIGSNQVEVKAGTYFVGTGAGNRVFTSGGILTVPSGSTVVYLNPVVSGTQIGVASVAPAGAITIANIAPAAITSGNIRQADITDARPFGTVADTNFEFAKVDIFVPVKQVSTDTATKRTMYMENVYVNSLDMSFQTNGVVTSSYKLTTDNKRWFLNNNSQIIVDAQVVTVGTSTMTMSQTPAVLANGNYTLKLLKNGNKMTEGVDYTVNAGTKTITFTVALVTGDAIKVRYCAAVGGPFFSPVPNVANPHPELAGGLKEGQVEIYLSDNLSSRLTRVQTARVSVPLQRDALMELGTLYPYDRPLQLPLTLTVSLELKDSDLELMARLAGHADGIATVNEINITDLVKNMSLVVKLYRENDVQRAKLPVGHPSKYVVKTITVPNLIPTSENWDVKVSSDATQTYDFNAHTFTISDSFTQGSIA